MFRLLVCLLVALVTAACSGAPADDEKAATVETAAGGASAGASQVSAADRDAILNAVSLQADAQGRVRNDCGDMITPQLLPVDLGPKVGPAVLLVMTGGPSQATCYGEGPGLTLFIRAGTSWAQI